MENNTLTAKEWIQQTCGFTPGYNKEILIQACEDYASYRTKELRGKIIDFRFKLSNNVCDQIKPLFVVTLEHPSDEVIEFAINNFKHPISVKEFDEHFNITSETKGIIN